MWTLCSRGTGSPFRRPSRRSTRAGCAPTTSSARRSSSSRTATRSTSPRRGWSTTRSRRAPRCERRFGFAIGRHTQNLIRNAVRLDLIGRLPKPRLFNELELILKEEEPVRILKRLRGLHLGPPPPPDNPPPQGE